MDAFQCIVKPLIVSIGTVPISIVIAFADTSYMWIQAVGKFVVT